jgi:hypothetical protein
MNSIWTFGDSFTFGMGCRIDQGINDGGDLYFKKYYQDSYDIWPNILGHQLEYDIKNLAKCGSSNDAIIDTIIDSFDLINQNDIVIIQKTYYERFDIPWSDRNGFRTQHKQFIDGSKAYSFSKDNTQKSEIEAAINFAVYFSNSSLYKERQDKRFNFLKKQLLNKIDKVYIWDIDDLMIKSIQKISQHSNYEFKDEHFSFIGHIQFANYIYDNLFEQKKNKII